MVKGQISTDYEKGRIVKLKKLGLSHRASELNKSKTVITNFLRNPTEYGTKTLTPYLQKITDFFFFFLSHTLSSYH